MSTVRELASEMSLCFVSGERMDGTTFRKLKDDRPKWMKDVVFHAHDDGDILPDDIRHEMIENAVDAISEADDDVDLNDLMFDWEPSAYTSDQTEWLHSRIGRVQYVDTYIDEMCGKIPNLLDAIKGGMHQEYREVFGAVLEKLTELADDTDFEGE